MPVLARGNPFEGIVSLFYPNFCAICRDSIPFPKQLCDRCADDAPKLRAPFCARCSQPFDGSISGPFNCANCADRVFYFEAAISAYRSQRSVREVMHCFKYGGQIALRRTLGEWLAETLDDSRLAGLTFDCLIPVPLHRARQRERGFNQAELLAREIQRHCRLPVCPALQRIRYTTTQTRFERAERIKNLAGAFRLRAGSDVRDCRVLLVDDVLTTGSTLSECAKVLREAGARTVYAVTAARG